MDEDTFNENFRNDDWPSRTYLCYKVEGPIQGSGVPLGQDKGILRNKVTRPPGPGTFRVEASGCTRGRSHQCFPFGPHSCHTLA
uniref:Uncharacterized protein n=1 Tax=Ursus americanus TaxID=9643 RepID=A0A452QSM4_URSAM